MSMVDRTASSDTPTGCSPALFAQAVFAVADWAERTGREPISAREMHDYVRLYLSGFWANLRNEQ
jgi:hypothetical protein